MSTAAGNARTSRDGLAERLRVALAAAGSPHADARIEPMPDTGLAHDHLRLAGTGVIARLPKQSQMDLPAADNLAYQGACFARAGASGHTPNLVETLPPSEPLPRGGLLVTEITGRAARLPDDLDAIATALARIHATPVPPRDERLPLRDPDDPLALILSEVQAQAAYLDAAAVAPATREGIAAEVARLEALAARPDRPAKRLISFDAHPGNFLIQADGTAVLVDLEKARYSAPALDLAHATLYTSTTWDIATSAVLSIDQVARTYRTWTEAFGAAADLDGIAGWHVPLRRAMWLWSVTWCAKWRALADRPKDDAAAGEDWSGENSDDALIAHVRDRVDHYLDPAIVRHVIDECDALAARIAA
jgi:hypothetical protein